MQRILTRALACAALLLTLNTFAGPADGTWTWTTPGRDGGPDRTSTLTLKSEGEKVTGAISGGGRGGNAPQEIKITDGAIKGDEVSFKVTREGRNGGNAMTTKYTGKISGDTMKLKSTFTNQNGEERSREFDAKKKTEEKK